MIVTLSIGRASNLIVLPVCHLDVQLRSTMARRSSGGRSASRPAPRAAPLKNPPQPARSAPPPAPVQGGGSVLGGIAGAVVDGVALGTGSAIAHRAVDAVLGPRTIQHEMVASPVSAPGAAPLGGSTSMGSDGCDSRSKAFQDCINHHGSDISKCQFYVDMLNECRRGSGTVLGA